MKPAPIGWGGDGIVGKVLALRPVVYIGRVSYSMYLWHWLLIVFAKHATDPTLSAWEMAGLSVASFVLASLSTELVERPFRTKKARAIRPRPVILVGTATLVVLGTLGAIQIRTPISLINAPRIRLCDGPGHQVPRYRRFHSPVPPPAPASCEKTAKCTTPKSAPH